MLLPSKELLSEVLGRDVDKVKGIEENTLIYGCVHSNRWYDEINIYELAHKCKEWAIKKEFIVTSQINTYASYSYIGLDELYGGFIKEFEANTEQEAIFKSCEWIMEQAK